jgi:peptidoglycan/xylan/chitin deacetylase (PgdA/CDA1 family)
MKAMSFELCHSKERIESEVGHAITVIAFPGGRYNDKVDQASREAGYSHLLSTAERPNYPGAAVWNRILVYGASQERLRARASGFESAIRSLLWM